MSTALSPRLLAVVDALPLRPGLRVLEVGGAPGAAARAVAERVAPDGHVLIVDRSERGIALTRTQCAEQIDAGLMSVLCAPVESFALPAGEAAYDLAFACRVGALDGRHPRLYADALARIAAALRPDGRLLVDTGDPLRGSTCAERRRGRCWVELRGFRTLTFSLRTTATTQSPASAP